MEVKEGFFSFFFKVGRALRESGRNRMYHSCCSFYQGTPSRWREGAKQTAFPCLPNGPCHRCGLAKGRAPAIDSVELKAECRILSRAFGLWSRLVWPRSHLNRWKESVFALALGLQWRPQRLVQTHRSGRAAKKGERILRRFWDEINKPSRTFPADVDYESFKWPLSSYLEKRWKLQRN